jgi:protein SCO1
VNCQPDPIESVAIRRRMFALALLLALYPSVLLQAIALPPIDQVSFSPLPGATLPLGVRFTDEYGRRIRLGDSLQARPALIVPAYYGCSNVCGIVLGGVAAALASSSLRAGHDVDVVVVSISPLDTPSDALAKKRTVLGEAAGRDDAWHFLTGNESAIEAVTSALGYRYAYDDAGHQYAHAAGIAVVAPGGRIVRILHGVAFTPADLRHALAATHSALETDAAIDGAAAKWLLCFHYDPTTGRYSFAAMTAVRSAGVLAFLALAGYLTVARRRERAPLHPTSDDPPR